MSDTPTTEAIPLPVTVRWFAPWTWFRNWSAWKRWTLAAIFVVVCYVESWPVMAIVCDRLIHSPRTRFTATWIRPAYHSIYGPMYPIYETQPWFERFISDQTDRVDELFKACGF
jgi:hypothetical protein